MTVRVSAVGFVVWTPLQKSWVRPHVYMEEPILLWQRQDTCEQNLCGNLEAWKRELFAWFIHWLERCCVALMAQLYDTIWAHILSFRVQQSTFQTYSASCSQDLFAFCEETHESEYWQTVNSKFNLFGSSLQLYQFPTNCEDGSKHLNWAGATVPSTVHEKAWNSVSSFMQWIFLQIPLDSKFVCQSPGKEWIKCAFGECFFFLPVPLCSFLVKIETEKIASLGQIELSDIYLWSDFEFSSTPCRCSCSTSLPHLSSHWSEVPKSAEKHSFRSCRWTL